ncbi:cupin domain-containing protein [Streptomyces sp. NPDC090077]|uniref:cupin domain-containing protein n=1 Tax=Streptomyces sp. NPDC090077 TaxID=3365938 RepID=UPI0037F782D3
MGGRQATVRRPRPAGAPRRTAPSGLAGREVVIPPGGCTGWHYHHVPLMAVVKSGTLTRFLSDGTVEVHPAGATFVEPAGAGHVHLGRNLGTRPVVLQITCALAEDDPWSVAAPAPPGAVPCNCPEDPRCAAQTSRRISPRTR